MVSAMPPYRMAVLSADQYERLICEIEFTDRSLAVIVSEEVPGKYEVSFFPGIEDPGTAFANGERYDAIAVDHETLIMALNEAVERLRALERPRNTSDAT